MIATGGGDRPISTYDLLPYLEEQPEPGRTKRADGLRSSGVPRRTPRGDPTLQFSWNRSARLSPGFTRLFPLPGDRLGPLLSQWWSDRATDTGVVDVHRLGLTTPIGADGRWVIPGHMYRPGLRRRIPVIVEMWPALTDWTRVTMDPRANLTASAQWFRDGHLSLERLVAQLTEPTQRKMPTPPARCRAQAVDRAS